MKRKVIAVVAILVLSVSIFSTGIATDNSTTQFDAPLTSIFGNEFTTSDFISSSQNRALLTICLLLDLSSSSKENISDNLSVMMSNATFVGIKDGLLIVNYYDNTYSYNVFYSPLLPDTAHYGKQYIGSNSSSILELTFGAVTDKYYKNSLSDILDVLKILKEAVDK